ncbi:flavin monoamine oxidase family protein [Mesorhizobium sp. 1B3]|uniref:flavin monoamine oxidase family protein n=1 Tax=Mesorhizobium sp. 1B3 TaxID=3243599 RepID=UPI003D96D03C
MRRDAIVVGAGFTGLAAAHELVTAGMNICVLEARDRVGGRVEACILGDGQRIDTGGQFLCEDMPEVLALARRFGKTLIETPLDGEFVVQPPTTEADAEKVYAASVAIRERMLAIDPADPHIAGLTVAAWLDRQDDTAAAKSAFRSVVEGLWCQDADRIPLWHLIDNDRRVTNEITELQYFLGETMHSLAGDIAAELGERVRLGCAVERIMYRPELVSLRTSVGLFEARQVIVAVPPVTASRIAYDPPLPERLAASLAVWESGAVIKCFVRYDRPFWRKRGLSGMVMWRDHHGLFACETSRDAGHAMLVVFMGGPRAAYWGELEEAGFRAELLSRLAAALGPEAAMPLEILRRDWTKDRWSGGGYGDMIMDMQAHDAEAVLRAGHPPLHFASSETALSFPGYVEGAIVAGREAARRVVELLSSTAS